MACCALLLHTPAPAFAADTQPPSVPGNVTATAGSSSPTIALVAWTASTDNVGVAGYRILRSVSVGGYFASIGTTGGLSFADKTGIPGQAYYYRVSAYDAAGNESAQSAAAGPVRATWTQSPHATYGSGSLCSNCHIPHRAATGDSIFVDSGGQAGELSVCYTCHDGNGASTNVKSGATDSFALTSGHSLEDLIDTGTVRDLTNACSSCHTPHREYTSRPKLWRSAINSATVNGNDTSWCVACHNDSQDWYVTKYGAYPALDSPTRDASGYPGAGTFPGRTVYLGGSTDPHSQIPSSTSPETRSTGDCRYCHAAHRSPQKYDAVVATFAPSTPASVVRDRTDGDYATLCFTCHSGGSWEASGAANVKQYITADGNDTSLSAFSGHRIKTAGGFLPTNAPMPCYDCHNPHGSARGNSQLLADTLGAGLSTTGGASSVRHTCLSCHSTADGFAWDSVTATYAIVPALATVEGLLRNGGTYGSGPDGGYNWLRLKDVPGHRSADAATSCYTCHGNAGGSASANNVHSPSAGVSGGGVNCYTCHSIYKDPMEDGTGAAAGSARTSFFHHVLGGTINTGSPVYYDGDYAPGPTGVYPSLANGTAETVFCVSCHADHDKFNGSKGGNLRSSISANTTAATDFIAGSNGGVCVSCHGSATAKDTANQASRTTSTTSDASTMTPVISGSAYGSSAHQYSVASSFGVSAGSTFSANCSKCHNDEQAKTFQQSALKFGPHYSATRRLLSALGGAVTDPLSENECFRCHSRVGDIAGGKSTDGRDAYGSAGAAMAGASDYVWRNFNGSIVSSHPVGAGKVECESCHNVHVVSATNTLTTDPDNTYLGYPFSTATTSTQAAFCLRCHDGAPPTYKSNATAYVPTTVTVSASTSNKSAFASRGHWAAAGSISSAEQVSCGVCHDSHGSKYVKLLGAYRAPTASNTIRGAAITGDNNTVCGACHTSASSGFPNASETASGYPADGTWPGMATYNTAFNDAAKTGSMHTNAATATIWPGSGYAGGDCKNCHDVHGTANTYDELRTGVAGVDSGTRLSSSNFSFCFACHDSGHYSGAYDVKQYYPTEASGTAVQSAPSTRFGHRTVTAGNLPAYSALPCYDCHNPHGSASPYGLVVTTMSNGATITVGDGSNEITLGPSSAAPAVRNFCFTCHATADTAKGWTGSAMVAVGAADRVEGILRQSTSARLRLPSISGHNEADSQSCYTCHGGSYSSSTSNNVHNPTGGLSMGGQSCYGCHGSYRVMDAADPSRASSYHHVLGTSSVSYTGDLAPNTGAYPTSATDVYCVSCHTDHNYFNAKKSANLRTDVAAAGSSTTNTDFIGSGSYGICVSCHSVTRAKQGMGTDQAALGTTATPVIAGARFNASAHDYPVVSSFGAGLDFSANCSKCHSDEQARSFQTSAYTFGTHWGSSVSILRALGSFAGNPPKAEACFKCHNSAGGRYGETLSAAAKATQGEFSLLSKHDLTKVSCVNCHNVHAANATTMAADPDNTYNEASLATTSAVNAYCLKCHDGTLPQQRVDATNLVPYTVSANATANVGTYYASDGHGAATVGPPFTGRTSTGYATMYNDVTNDWTNDLNVLGAPDAATANSAADSVFDMRSTFTFPSLGSIDEATLTVRSRASGGWGGLTGGNTAGSQICYPSSTVQNGSWAIAGSTPAPTRHESIDDPAGSPDDAVTYLNGTNTTEYRAGVSAPSIPADATNISVSIFWRGRDGTSNTNTVWSRILYNGTWSNAATINRNPTTTWTTYQDTWATAPGGAAWTPANVALVTGLGIDASGTGPNWVTQMYIRVDYQVPNYYDDVWAIQYTTDGSNWTTVDGGAVDEAALTDHAVNLTGVLTASNSSNFAVRIKATAVGAADNVGTVAWDASTLQLRYSGNDAGGARADCRDCHEQHGSSLAHLLKSSVAGTSVPSYADTADEAQCLACHRAGNTAGASDIARYYPSSAYGTADSAMARSGHRTKTAGTLAANSAVPCRQCHDPHGGAGSGHMLEVRTQVTAGVNTIIGDAAGELAMSDATQTPSNAVNVRRFCLSCHTTSDATPMGWNGSADTAVAAGCQVLGIGRTGGVLRLPALANGVKGHAAADTAYSCYVCHGDDFSAANSVNAHDPSAGESRGGIPCYTCHTVYQTKMEDGSGTTTHSVGIDRTSTYHHVLGQSGGSDGDTISYPTSGVAGRNNVFCLSCHVDHTLFSDLVNGTYSRSANLRLAYGSTAPASTADATNTDFAPSGGTNGVCLGCHSTRVVKDNTNQKSETNSSVTPTITASAYDVSAHDYVATSTFTDTSTFRANCAKCHDSEIDGGGMEAGKSTAGFQTSTNKFSVHYSAARRILAAMGVPITDPPSEEVVCLKCHSHASDGLKATDGLDWYGKAPMSATSEALYGLQSSTYGHDGSKYDGIHRPSPEDETQAYISANKHVECADCHNVHSAQASLHAVGTNAVSGALAGVSGVEPAYTAGTNWTAPASYSAAGPATKEYQICMKCHSGANTALTTWDSSWTNTALEFSPYNQSYHPVISALPVTDPGTNGSSRLAANQTDQGGWTPGMTMYCSDCHGDSAATPAAQGPHGSTVSHLLKGPNTYWPTNSSGQLYRIGSGNSGWAESNLNGLFCRNCHRIYNGTSYYNNVHTEHGNSQGNSAAAACVNCHTLVPHGGKVSRLIATRAAMPTRYAYQGNLNNVAVTGFRKASTPTGYSKSFCTAVDPATPTGLSCTTHSGGTANEQW